MISMIVCTDTNGGIGVKNDLLFNIKDDMKFFRETTVNKKVVMGYNTWVSLPKKPLPKRENYVLYDGDEEIEGATILRNWDEVIELGKENHVFLIGGAMVYNDALKLDIVDEAFVTWVDAFTEAEVYLDVPELNMKLVHRDYIQKFEFGNVKVQLFRYYK